MTILQEIESIATRLTAVMYPQVQRIKRSLRAKHWPKSDRGGRKRASERLALIEQEGRRLARRMDDLRLLDGISRRISKKACRGLRVGNACDRDGCALRLPSGMAGANS